MRDKKKYGWLSGLMSNVLGGTREYNFNNVTYIVEPRFQAIDSNDAKMPQEKFARIIEKSAAHLQVTPDSDKIQAEYVSAANPISDRKEQNAEENSSQTK